MKNLSLQGVIMPALGFGTYKLYDDDCVAAVDFAINNGYRHIDTAQVYENEEAVGAGIKRSGRPRGDIFLTTKVWRNEFAGGTVAQSVDNSLRKLQTDYVDLLLVHWPFPEKPIGHMVEQIMKAKDTGKARHIGVSNFTVAQMEEAIKVSGGTVICNQVEYHPYLSQKPVLDFVRKHDMALTAYSPIGRGKAASDAVLKEIGMKYGKNAGQVCLRWHMQQDNVAAIPKSATPQNIKNNIDIFDFELSAEDMKAIHALATPDGRQISPDWSPVWDKAA